MKKYHLTTDFKVFVIVCLAILLIWLSVPICIYFFLSKYGISKAGSLGDTFGILTCLFSGLAFAGLVYTILVQKQELEETREEFKIQNQTLKIQRFENTFFQIFNLHQELVKEMKFQNLQGKDAFVMFVINSYNSIDFGSNYLKLQLQNPPNFNNVQLEIRSFGSQFVSYVSYKINMEFQKLFNKNSDLLFRYFRSLFHLYKYLFTSELISDEESQFYAKLVSAQLSEFEMVILCYNCMKKNYGYPKFAWLVKEYNILENLNIDLLLLRERDWNFFLEHLPTEIPDDLKIGRQTV